MLEPQCKSLSSVNIYTFMQFCKPSWLLLVYKMVQSRTEHMRCPAPKRTHQNMWGLHQKLQTNSKKTVEAYLSNHQEISHLYSHLVSHSYKQFYFCWNGCMIVAGIEVWRQKSTLARWCAKKVSQRCCRRTDSASITHHESLPVVSLISEVPSRDMPLSLGLLQAPEWIPSVACGKPGESDLAQLCSIQSKHPFPGRLHFPRFSFKFISWAIISRLDLITSLYWQ